MGWFHQQLGPLFIVDGIPSGGIDYLNPNDIENISVLKDAASATFTARWKQIGHYHHQKGTANAPATLSYDMYVGMQEPVKYMALLNAEQYATLMNESRAAAGLIADPRWRTLRLLAGNQLARGPLPAGTDGQPQRAVQERWNQHVCEPLQPGRHHWRREGRFERTTFRLGNEQQAGERFRVGQTINFTHINRALGGKRRIQHPCRARVEHRSGDSSHRPNGTYAYSPFINSDIANPINKSTSPTAIGRPTDSLATPGRRQTCSHH